MKLSLDPEVPGILLLQPRGTCLGVTCALSYGRPESHVGHTTHSWWAAKVGFDYLGESSRSVGEEMLGIRVRALDLPG